jgi:uncharacterized protein YbjT (DUF2867 family)
LVIGVTGAQGGGTARHLLRAGWRVRGLTRNPNSRRACALRAQGVELVRGNLEDRSALSAAMTGVHGVHGVTPMEPKGYSAQRELHQGILVAEVAADVGVSGFVFSSVTAAQDSTGVPHVDVKGAIENRIHELGLPATIVRSNVFMDNLVNPRLAALYWWLAPAVIGWDKPLAWVAADDVGAVAAHVLQDPARWAGHRLEIVGDRKSLGDARRIYRNVVGRAPFRIPMPVWAFRRFVGEELVTMWEWQGSHDFGRHSPQLERMAIEFTGLEGFLRRWSMGYSSA